MRLVIIPPYRAAGINYTPSQGHFLVHQLVANMKARGQLEGVEIDIDDGYPTDHTAETRDAEVAAGITVGFLKRVRECSEMGKYDAIATSGGIDLGFFAARMISSIPIAFSVHSAMHVASLIGERFSMIELTDPVALLDRRSAQNYGLDRQMASARNIGRTSNYVLDLIRKHKKEDRVKVTAVKQVIDEIVAQCIQAIDKDRADTVVLGCPHLQCLEEEVRKGLNDSGHGEIPIVCELYAAVEMAKAMVNMKAMQSPRAYPTDLLKAKPEFR